MADAAILGAVDLFAGAKAAGFFSCDLLVCMASGGLPEHAVCMFVGMVCFCVVTSKVVSMRFFGGYML